MEYRGRQDTLGVAIAADFAAAACTALVTSPIVAIIDRSIIANFSGKQPLLSSLSDGFGLLLTNPLLHLRNPSVLAVFTVYGLTYAATNVTETVSSKAFKRDPAIPKLMASSMSNTGLTVWKDSLLTKWYGNSCPKPVKLPSLASFAFRDSVTMAAAFTFPPIVSKHLQGPQMKVSKKSADFVSQLLLPCAVQFITTPIHLLGLDIYNRPTSTEAGGLMGRFKAIRQEYFPSTFARMGRILPAFGFGGVINKGVRTSLVDAFRN